MNDVKILIKRFKELKIDIPAMINNSVLFVLAWIIVFWVFQFFTILPAFSIGVKMLIYNSFIDFNSVNTASSDKELWASPDNIYNIFLTPVIMISVFALIAVLFLIKWNSDRLNMRRFLFWVILCCIIRLFGNFIFGHLFNLWSWNLVTDFMGITGSSMFIKYALILVIIVLCARLFVAMSREIKKLFNPFIKDRFSNLNSNVFLPMLLGIIFLMLWNLPQLPKNEIGCFLLMIFMVVFFMCRPFMNKYKGIYHENLEEDYIEKINKIPIIVLGVLFAFNLILMRGILLENSAYRYFFIENVIMSIIIIAIVVVLIIAVRVYNRRVNARKRAYKRMMAEIDSINATMRTSGNENWEQGNKINLDKYKEDYQETNEEENMPKIDFKNSNKYGFKTYDLSKYNKKNW